MRRRTRKTASYGTATALLGLGLLGACSLVNEFAEVVEGPLNGNASTVAITVTVASGAGAGGAGGAGGNGSGTGGVGADSGAGGGLPLATVLAVGGRFLGQNVLYALDANTGATLTQEFANVAALAYDGANDAYFVFLADALPVTAGERGRLETRRFDWMSGGWKTLGALDNILLPNASTRVSVVRKRLVYLVDTANSGTAVARLDTANLESLNVLQPESTDVAAAGVLQGLVGTRHPSGDGGFLHAIYKAPEGPACRLALLPIEVTGQAVKVAQSSVVVGAAFPCGSSAGWAPDPNALTHLFSVPPAAGGGEATLISVVPGTGQLVASVAVAVTGAPTHALVPFGLAACAGIAFVGVATGEITARSFSAAPAVPLSLDGPLDGLGYEPRQRLLFARHAASDKSFSLRAIATSGDCFAPKLTLLDSSRWKAPIYLEPVHVAVGDPVPLACSGDCSL
ncbi:MAG: hypothetical protein EXR75_14850 [Myxococcales bacterium]|nr:hypothetical protein [Myxococcales bacterium]